MKKAISVLLTSLIITVLFTSNVYADESSRREVRSVYSVSENLAIQYIRQNEPGFEIVSSDPLYDGTNAVKGYLFHLKRNETSGYITVFALHGTLKVTEACFEKDKLTEENKIYYNGLLEYDVLRNGVLCSARTNEVIPIASLCRFEDVDIVSSLQNYQAIENAYQNQLRDYSGVITLDYAVTAIDQHDAYSGGNYKCMQTSAAMLIQYYDEHYYSNIASVSGGALINVLSSYISLDGGTYTTLSTLKTGLGNYIYSRGYTSIIQSNSCDLGNDTLPMNFDQTMYSEIANERPMIMIIGSEAVFTYGYNPCSGSGMHAVLVRGVNITSSDTYIYVTDPWDATPSTIIWDPVNTADRTYFAVYSVVRVHINS